MFCALNPGPEEGLRTLHFFYPEVLTADHVSSALARIQRHSITTCRANTHCLCAHSGMTANRLLLSVLIRLKLSRVRLEPDVHVHACMHACTYAYKGQVFKSISACLCVCSLHMHEHPYRSVSMSSSKRMYICIHGSWFVHSFSLSLSTFVSQHLPSIHLPVFACIRPFICRYMHTWIMIAW